jgi:hypothetical protein
LTSIRKIEITSKPLEKRGKQWPDVKDAQVKQCLLLNFYI